MNAKSGSVSSGTCDTFAELHRNCACADLHDGGVYSDLKVMSSLGGSMNSKRSVRSRP